MENKSGNKEQNNLYAKATVSVVKKYEINKKILINTITSYKNTIEITIKIFDQCLANEKDIFSFFNYYLNFIKTELKKNKNEYYDKILFKYKNLKNKYLDNFTEERTELNLIYSNKFLLCYSLKEKDSIIKSLKQSIQSSKKCSLFREKKRESLLDNKKEPDFIQKYNDNMQSNMLFLCKKFNKYKNKCLKDEDKIKKLNDGIKEFKDEIKIIVELDNSKNNNSNNINNTLGDNKSNNEKNNIINPNNLNVMDNNPRNFDQKVKSDISTQYEINDGKKIKMKSPIISEFKKVDELFDASLYESQSKQIIINELDSDDEIDLSVNIKSLNADYKSKSGKKIPQLNFNQINFNKLKQFKEVDLSSIQRRKHKVKNNNADIRKLNKKISDLKKCLEIKKEKVEEMKVFMEELNNIFYDVLKPLKTDTSFCDRNYDFKGIFDDFEHQIKDKKENISKKCVFNECNNFKNEKGATVIFKKKRKSALKKKGERPKRAKSK